MVYNSFNELHKYDTAVQVQNNSFYPNNLSSTHYKGLEYERKLDLIQSILISYWLILLIQFKIVEEKSIMSYRDLTARMPIIINHISK